MSSIDAAATDDLFYHTAETIVAHPRFARARRAYVQAMLGLYEHDLFKSRLLIAAIHTAVFLNILSLHFAQDRADRATWPTNCRTAPAASRARRDRDAGARSWVRPSRPQRA